MPSCRPFSPFPPPRELLDLGPPLAPLPAGPAAWPTHTEVHKQGLPKLHLVTVNALFLIVLVISVPSRSGMRLCRSTGSQLRHAGRPVHSKAQAQALHAPDNYKRSPLCSSRDEEASTTASTGESSTTRRGALSLMAKLPAAAVLLGSWLAQAPPASAMDSGLKDLHVRYCILVICFSIQLGNPPTHTFYAPPKPHAAGLAPHLPPAPQQQAVDAYSQRDFVRAKDILTRVIDEEPKEWRWYEERAQVRRAAAGTG